MPELALLLAKSKNRILTNTRIQCLVSRENAQYPQVQHYAVQLGCLPINRLGHARTIAASNTSVGEMISREETKVLRKLKIAHYVSDWLYFFMSAMFCHVLSLSVTDACL